MTTQWQDLIGNLAVTSLFILGWTHAQVWFGGLARRRNRILLGLFMGTGAAASMLLAFQLQPGVYFDLRSSLLALAAFFGGPLATAAAALVAGAYRVALGGAGMGAGVAAIALASLIGLGGHYLTRHRDIRRGDLVLLAAAITGSVVVVLAVLSTTIPNAFEDHWLPMSMLSFVATCIGGLAVLHARRSARERDLLMAALNQAPDFHYVKNLRGEFVAVNHAVARQNGFPTPESMVGSTDFDIDTYERAEKLFIAEQRMLRSGDAVLEFEEPIFDKAGAEHWYSTSKVPLRDREGEIFGLAGVTRDITERKLFEREMMQSRNLLSYAMTEMSDGLAIFDNEGVLTFCNERYRACFPRTSDVRKPGAHIRDILKAVVERGEQIATGTGDSAAWIEKIVESMRFEGDEEVHLFDGRWLHLRNRRTEDGATIVVVSDVTELKASEADLRLLTNQLSLLATTDGLTGLVNRRGFDQALEAELNRCARERVPLSLLMIDVDHFKSYNDLYGHPAGDECLREIGRCLMQALKRTGDLAARYGGEEFVVILPNTDEEGAYVIGQRIRAALAKVAVPHMGSETGVLTVSIGLSCRLGTDEQRRPNELIASADEALYAAKAAGRDRIVGWRQRRPAAVRQAS